MTDVVPLYKSSYHVISHRLKYPPLFLLYKPLCPIGHANQTCWFETPFANQSPSTPRRSWDASRTRVMPLKVSLQ